MLYSLNELRNFEIHATDGDIGKVRGFYFDDRTWEIHYLVVDTNKWLPDRKVLVSPAVIQGPDAEKRKLSVGLTRERIEDSPSIAEDAPIVRSVQDELNSHYGWRTTTFRDAQDEEFSDDNDEEGDLRSTQEVLGYQVEAVDGDVGLVRDFIIDDENWVIRYMVIDMEKWAADKQVLISPDWVESLGWDDGKVYIDLPKDSLMNAPDYDSSALPGPDYEARLFNYYKRRKSFRDDTNCRTQL